MRKVSYQFDIDQKVKTPFGDDALVAMLGFDGSGQQYFVKTSRDGQWYKEKQLVAACVESIQKT